MKKRGDLIEGLADPGTPEGGVLTVQGAVGATPVLIAGGGGAPQLGAGMYAWTGAAWTPVLDPTADGIGPNGLPGGVPMMLNAAGGGGYDRLRGNSISGVRGTTRRVAVATAESAANAGVVLTLVAPGSSLYYYITRILITRSATAAVAGGALLKHTTTQLNGMAWQTGNAIAAGQMIRDADESWAFPYRSDTANTAVTVTAPAGGATVVTRIQVYWYIDFDQA